MNLPKKLLASLITLVLYDAHAAVMREDISVQDYRDFAENLGKYSVGKEGIEVFKMNGTSAGILNFPMPDFGAVNSLGYSTLVGGTYTVSVAHNTGYSSVDYGNRAKYSTQYKIININKHPTADFHSPRLNKVVTEAAPVPTVTPDDVRNDHTRYKYFARVGGGTQDQINPTTQKGVQQAGAYTWKSGGTFTNPTFENWRLRWTSYAPTDPRVEIFSSSALAGDSGSPLFVYDNVEKIWKIYGVLTSGTAGITYNQTSYVIDMQLSFLNEVIAKNTDPDVLDVGENGDIHWTLAQISQGEKSWAWHGVNEALPTSATNEELDATKDLRFNGEGGLIVLDDAVNHGAAKLRFSNDYHVISAEGENNTWVGGGIEIDEGKTVDWEVNGLAGDTLHKIGAGTLYVNAIGNNGGALNVGDGVVELAQQADAQGHQTAFSTITIVSGRPTVRIDGENQISGDDINFGYRGGTLDLNGYDMSFTAINHNDSGATILNANPEKLSTLTLSTKADDSFMGTLGSKETQNNLNLSLNGTGTGKTYKLAGDTWLNSADIAQAKLSLYGRPTPHAGGAVFANDWIATQHEINQLSLKEGAQLIVGELATLNTKMTVNEGASLGMTSRSRLQGEVDLAKNTQLTVEAGRGSTDLSSVGNADAFIDAAIAGEGSLLKSGTANLFINSDNTFSGGTTVESGGLILNGSLASDTVMKSGTLLGGNGSLTHLELKDNVTLSPYFNDTSDVSSQRLNASSFTPSVQRLSGDLVSGVNNAVVLRAQIEDGSPENDRLLIAGDVINNDEPIYVQVTPSGSGFMTDVDEDDAADNEEGLSLIQVGGKANENTFKLAGGYVARGAFAYTLYAFAPGRSSADQRQVDGSGDQYWDYRLQNQLLSEGDNTIPIVNVIPVPDPTPDPVPDPIPDPIPDPVPEPVPDPIPAPAPDPVPDPIPAPAPDPVPDPIPAPAPDPVPDPIPDPVPAPAPEPIPDPVPAPTPEPIPDPVPAPAPEPSVNKSTRAAVTPQVPSYLSLPSALLSYNSRIINAFHEEAQLSNKESSSLFLQYLHAEDTYHSSQRFADYGYNYKQKQDGWLLGGNLLRAKNDTQELEVSAGLSYADLDITPDAVDGESNTHYTVWGVSTLLTWQHTNGWLIEMGADAAKYNGKVFTDLRGRNVAQIDAKSVGTTLDVGYHFVFNDWQITPTLGGGIQYLNVDDFTDIDNTRVQYDDIIRPTGRAGVRYRYDWESQASGKWAAVANTQIIKDFSHHQNVKIGDADSSRFDTDFTAGLTGSAALIDFSLINSPLPNVSLNAGIQYQQRLEGEGSSYWQTAAGVKITF